METQKYNGFNDHITIHDLTVSVNQLTHRVGELVDRYDKIVKYLLVTVCLLAIGKGVTEFVQFFKQ